MSTDNERLRDALVGLGLSQRQAEVGAAGRAPVGPSGFDGLVARFRGLGLSESAARRAVVGYQSESQARAAFDKAAESRRRPAKASSRTSSSRQPATVRRASSQASTSRKPTGGRVMVSEAAVAEHEMYTELRRAGVLPEHAAWVAAERAHRGSNDRRLVELREALLR